MKVAVVTAYYPSARNPWEGRSAYQTLQELAKTEDVHVFSPLSRDPSWLPIKRNVVSAADLAFSVPGPAVTYRGFAAIPMISRPFNGASMAKALLADVRAFQPDVIINFRAYPDGYAAVKIGRKLGVPVILKANGSDINRPPGRLVARRIHETLRDADTVTTVSNDLLETVIRLGASPDHSVAILNGCNTDVFHPRDRATARRSLSLPLDARIVLYAGRYDVRKGLVELIDALATLRERVPDVQAWLLGNGPDEAKLRERIAALNLTDAVHLHPPVSGDAVSEWNAACDLLTLPSYMEGCPNVVLEALSSGRPVVATNVGGIPELVDNTCGRLVPSQDAAALAQGLKEVLSMDWDPNVLAAAHSRSWSDTAGELRAVIHQTLERYQASHSR